MEWKSFVTLKQGKRQMPRIDELEILATLLEVDPSFVFQVARGVPASEIATLLAREHRWRALLERVTDAVFTIDAHGRLQDVNERFCALVGREVHELAEHLLVDMVTPESAPRLLAALATVARDGEAHGVEVALRDPRGRDRVVELDAARIEDLTGASIGAQLTARDVTEERRLLRELDAQRRLLQTIYDCIPAACILFDGDGTILAANPRVENVCPLVSSELVGRNAFDVFGNPGPSGCPVTRAFLTGQNEQQVSRLPNRAGNTVYVHRIAGPIVHEGKVEQVIEIMVDVSGQIQAGDLRVLALCRTQPDGEEGRAADRVERRHALPRAVTSFPVRYNRGDLKADARVTNLSFGGLCLHAHDGEAVVGDEVELEWSLPGDDVPVRARAVVVWTRRDDFGVRFIAVEPNFAPVAQGLRKSS
jgi:PAS domain S-box-containing protein